jgi:hypothetical protein
VWRARKVSERQITIVDRQDAYTRTQKERERAIWAA